MIPDPDVRVLATLVRTEHRRLSQWTTLVTKHVLFPENECSAEFHSLAQADYITMLGVTNDGRIPIVRQYRPALDRLSLELPGGLLDAGELPVRAATREYYEETGFRVISEPVHLGRLAPDSGRLENGLWCFFGLIADEPDDDWQPEGGVERLVVETADLREAIMDGRFDHAPHIALIGLAMIRGVFAWSRA